MQAEALLIELRWINNDRPTHFSLNIKYSGSLNNVGIRGADPQCSGKSKNPPMTQSQPFN